MKAAFTLTPPESRRLLAKAVANMPAVQAALHNPEAYVILPGSTANAYVVEELTGRAVPPASYTAGIVTHRLLCVTDVEDRDSAIPTILNQGQIVQKTMAEALNDFCCDTVIIKGANAVDPAGNVGVVTSGFDGGTVAAMIGTVTSQGLKVIVPVGLEKLVASVPEAIKHTGAKTLDYTMGADFGMYCLTNTIPVTEVEAFRILCDVQATHVASGGTGDSYGSVVLIVEGEQDKVEAAIALVESIKGEPSARPLKGTCAVCRYACVFAGTAEEDLPAWLQKTEADLA